MLSSKRLWLWKSCRESIVFVKYKIDVCDNHVTAEFPLSKICLFFIILVSGLEKVFVSLIIPPPPLPRRTQVIMNYNIIRDQLTHLPLGILLKNALKLVKTIFWSLSGNKELKCTKKPFRGCALQGLLFQIQNISF